MNVYVVEDDILHLEDVIISLENLGYNCVGHSDESLDAIQRIEKVNPDVILIDIHLHGKEAGITLSRMIKSMFQLPVIFTTSDRSQHMIESATDVEPVAYLTKPIDDGALHAALMLAQKQNASAATINSFSSSLYIKHREKLVKVSTASIVYVFSDTKNYCSLLTKDGKKLTFRNSLLGFKKLLDPHHFVQIHRGYLVNLSFINSYSESENSLVLLEQTLPVGSTFKKELFKHLKII